MVINAANALGTWPRLRGCKDDIDLYTVVGNTSGSATNNAWSTTTSKVGTKGGGWSRGWWTSSGGATTSTGGTVASARAQSFPEESTNTSGATTGAIDIGGH